MSDENTLGGSANETEGPGGASTGLRSPKVLGGAGVAVAALILVIAGFVLTRGDDKPVVTKDTVATTTTSTTIETLPSGVSEVATVKSSLTEIRVLTAAPADWLTSGPSIVPTTVAESPPWSRDTAPKRDAIPTELSPVVGRYATPDGWRFENPGPYDPAQPLTFLVSERRGAWLKVHLPVRPNGTEGYIPVADVDLHQTTKRIELHVGEHRLTAYDGANKVLETTAVTGVSNTPTPTGTFFVTDVVPYQNTGGSYGPFALATNGYSETLNEFDSGVPVIALHGTNRPELMGQDRSNGCVRVENDVINQLAKDFGQGTPVFIWP
ncbi:MAG: L,D-transpeptidase [Microthrixaceae bacterium]